jgi:hypothetical protein
VKTPARLSLLFLFASSICAAQLPQRVKPEWAVFSSPLKWESPPAELQAKYKSARSRIRVFFPSGEYGEVSCYVIRQGDGTVTISRGDGDVVGIGNWKVEGERVVISLRIVYRTVVIMGKPIPESELVERLKVSKRRYWTVWDDNEQYTPLPQFKDWTYLATLIRCDREYFDGKKQVDGIQPCMPQPTN